MARQYPQLGPLKGPGTTTSDSIPAMYSKGEVVISAADVKAIGKAFGKNYLSNLVKTASKDTPPKLGAQTMVKDGKLKASGGFGLDGEDVSGGIDWNQGKTDWDQGMPDWNEGQTKFMGGTLFAAGGFNPEDLTPFGNKKIIPTNNRAIAPRTNLGTRAIIPASDAIPKTKASIGVSNTKAALGNSAVIPPGQALKPPGKNIVPIGKVVRPSIPAEHINIRDVSQSRIGQANKPAFNPVENINVNPSIDANAVNQAKQTGARLDTMARPSGNGFRAFNNEASNIANNAKLGVSYPGSGQAIKAASIDSTNIIDNGLKAAGSAIKSNALKIGGTALAVGPEAYNTYKDVTTKGMDASDKAARIAEGATRTGAALAGAEAGAGLGLSAGPIGSIAGGLAGGALGYYAPDILNKMQSSVTGNNIKFPSDKAAELQAANSAVVSSNVPSNKATNQAQSFTPKPDASKVTPGQYSPYWIDQLFPGQSDKVAPSRSGSEDAPSRSGSEDAPQYKAQPGFIQTDNSIPYNVAKQSDGTNTVNFTNPDGTGTGTLSGLSGEQAGRFRDGKGAAYSGPGLPDVKPAQIGAQQMQQPYLGENNSGVDESNTYLNQMRDIAVNGGPDRFMSLSEMIGAKHRQRAAQDVLNNITKDNQNKRQNSLENAKLGVDTLLAKQRMDQAKTQQEYEAAQQDFMNSLEVGNIGYQMKRDEKGDQAASAKAAQENAIATRKLGIEESQLNQPKPITTNTYGPDGLVNGQNVGVVQYDKDGNPVYKNLGKNDGIDHTANLTKAFKGIQSGDDNAKKYLQQFYPEQYNQLFGK